MEKLLRLDKRPTVVFACSDSIAIGVYQTAWRHGLRIPQDMSVIGYDNIALAEFLSPAAFYHSPAEKPARQISGRNPVGTY